ncbi:hypothetical protein QFZ77_001240 [Paenibacillus sp. V4I3]|nr:hypothetical protein [Paenibacillus sp. V4I3]MDQ0891533.1 hypothetical protein [Paenibacillus sp. V4I9]
MSSVCVITSVSFFYFFALMFSERTIAVLVCEGSLFLYVVVRQYEFILSLRMNLDYR